MNAFSSSLVTVLAPILAASLYAFGGLPLVIIIDLVSFVFAFAVLAFVIKIPEEKKIKKERASMFSGTREGLAYLRSNQGILMIILTMALLNFLSRLTYENILSPMILARSGNNHEILGVVNAAMGVGGIVGGLIVSSGRVKGNSVKMIYSSAMLSFLRVSYDGGRQECSCLVSCSHSGQPADCIYQCGTDGPAIPLCTG